MTKRIKNLLWIALSVALFFSCASAPEPQEETVETSSEELTVAQSDMMTFREAAMEAKAPKAAAELFDRGEELKTAAESALADGDTGQAVKLYKEGELEYKAALEEAEKVKAEAIAAMEAADRAISQVQSNADSAIEEAGEDRE